MTDQPNTAPTLADLRARRDDILRLAAQYGAYNLRVFGSVARGEATEGSDIDFLVDLAPHFSLLKMSGLVRALQAATGWRVEVASAAHLRDELRDAILGQAQPL